MRTSLRAIVRLIADSRYAPSFIAGYSPKSVEYPYTATTIARYLGV